MTGELVLIDTSAWVLALKKALDPSARDKIDALLAENRVAIIPIISMELLGGVRSREEFRRLKSRLGVLHQIPLGELEWEESARIAFELRCKGITIPHIDIIIGTAALLHDLSLLHADKHFDLMAEEVPLKIESVLS